MMKFSTGHDHTDPPAQDDNGDEPPLGPLGPSAALPVPQPTSVGRARSIHNSTSTPSQTKRRKHAPLPDAKHLPTDELYYRSYMHRTPVTHIVLASHTVITASTDGALTFWHREKAERTAEKDKVPTPQLTFIRTFAAHDGSLSALVITPNHEHVLTSATSDRSLKCFSVLACDLLHFTELPFEPGLGLCILPKPDRVLVPVRSKPIVAVYLLSDLARRPKYFRTQHGQPLSMVTANYAFNAIITADEKGVLDFVQNPDVSNRSLGEDADQNNDTEQNTADGSDRSAQDGAPSEEDINSLPALSPSVPGLSFRSRLRSDLFYFAKKNIRATSITPSPDGQQLALTASDGQILIMSFRTGRLLRVYSSPDAAVGDEPAFAMPQHQRAPRLARDRLLRRDRASCARINVAWDETGAYILYASVLGVHVVHVTSNRCVRVLGLREPAVRFLTVAVGVADCAAPAATGDVPRDVLPPLVIASAFDSERFFLFGSCSSGVGSGGIVSASRDVYNERPMTKPKSATGTDVKGAHVSDERLFAQRATLHTTMGDITFSLLPASAPKAVENFVRHTEEGYFSGVVFHRVIRDFMIQTGDPDGDGTGGESIWGEPFDDEIDPGLSHDEGVVSMANAGPKTNGSQFFIVCRTSRHLDGKHSIFGKVVKGMGVLRQIESVRTDKHDRPETEVRIESISLLRD